MLCRKISLAICVVRPRTLAPELEFELVCVLGFRGEGDAVRCPITSAPAVIRVISARTRQTARSMQGWRGDSREAGQDESRRLAVVGPQLSATGGASVTGVDIEARRVVAGSHDAIDAAG